MRKIDITGQKFGRLTVICENGKTNANQLKWLCICECGKEATVAGSKLKKGHTSSCGCLHSEFAKNVLGQQNITHGKSKSITFGSWYSMIRRCTDPKIKEYKWYGGRGIKVCDRWINSFQNFFDDMGERPSVKHTIDREEVNGNYEPSNCRWATTIEQGANKRSNKWFEYDGKKMILTDWARHLGITANCFFHSITYYKSVEKAIEFHKKKKQNSQK